MFALYLQGFFGIPQPSFAASFEGEIIDMTTELVDPMASVRAYLEAEKAANTRRAYTSDFTQFRSWCDRAGETALPATPISVAKYIASLADGGAKVATIERRIAAIRYVHHAAGHEPPTNAEGVKAVMRGIRRSLGRRPVRKKPATAELLVQALKLLPETLRGKRDRAMLLVGFGAARRRSEIVALQVDDVTVYNAGMILHIRRSKTDQDGRGRDIPVPRGRELKPVAALQDWLSAAGIKSGPVFREIDRHGNIGTVALSDRAVARIVKAAFKPLGLDVADFSGHSLRAGFVTTSLARKVDPLKIMGITSHVKVDTLKAYDRREQDFEDHAGGDFL